MSTVETALLRPTAAALDRAAPSLSREAWLLDDKDAGRQRVLLASEANERNLPAVLPPLLEACCLEDSGTAMDSGCCSSVLRSLVRLRITATVAAGITAPLAASIRSLAIPGRPTRVKIPCLPPTPTPLLLLLVLLLLPPARGTDPLLGGRWGAKPGAAPSAHAVDSSPPSLVGLRRIPKLPKAEGGESFLGDPGRAAVVERLMARGERVHPLEEEPLPLPV
jgi:hypothetical protein